MLNLTKYPEVVFSVKKVTRTSLLERERNLSKWEVTEAISEVQRALNALNYQE